jgi:2-haloalkanoic acid dehalogenase type II
MFQQIRLICFDLDNTFWPVEPVIRGADIEVARWLAQHYPQLAATHSIEHLRAARFELARSRPDRAHDMTWLRVEAMALAAESQGLPRDIGQQAFDVFIEARHRVDWYPDVKPALRALANKFRLATLSNGNADMARLGAAHQFEFCLSAHQIGVAKPDPRAFAEILRRSGCAAQEVLYVGDEPEHDVLGSRRAGLHTVWLRRNIAPTWPEGEPEPVLTVSDLEELARLALA